MTNRRKWQYTMTDIALVMRRSVHTVRDDKVAGKFDPADFCSVVQYILKTGVNVEVRNGEVQGD